MKFIMIVSINIYATQYTKPFATMNVNDIRGKEEISQLISTDRDYELTMNHIRRRSESIPDSTTTSQIANNERFVWRSCCLELDSRAIQFLAKLLVSAGALMFCAYQMATLPTCDTQNYRDLFTMIIGVWIETPRIMSSRDESTTLVSARRENARYLWRSCCFQFDSRAVQFMTRFFMTVGALMFCGYQSLGRSRCEVQPFSAIFSFILGTWIDSPKIKK